jgi:pyruvate kinase
MLSGETATGDYPVECVQMMDRILKAYEQDKPKPVELVPVKWPDRVIVIFDQLKRLLSRK